MFPLFIIFFVASQEETETSNGFTKKNTDLNSIVDCFDDEFLWFEVLHFHVNLVQVVIILHPRGKIDKNRRKCVKLFKLL
jgi:hypothetical protein